VREPLATRRWLSGATLLLFSVSVLPPPARADISGSLRCRAGTVLMRTDSKTCPTERGRAIAVWRPNGHFACVHSHARAIRSRHLQCGMRYRAPFLS